jgi:hypothetical protein
MRLLPSDVSLMKIIFLASLKPPIFKLTLNYFLFLIFRALFFFANSFFFFNFLSSYFSSSFFADPNGSSFGGYYTFFFSTTYSSIYMFA